MIDKLTEELRELNSAWLKVLAEVGSQKDGSLSDRLATSMPGVTLGQIQGYPPLDRWSCDFWGVDVEPRSDVVTACNIDSGGMQITLSPGNNDRLTAIINGHRYELLGDHESNTFMIKPGQKPIDWPAQPSIYLEQ